MAIPSTVPVKLSQIKAEFSGPTPSKLTNFLKNAGYVSSSDTGVTNVPTAVPIKETQLTGTAKYIPPPGTTWYARTLPFTGTLGTGDATICCYGSGYWWMAIKVTSVIKNELWKSSDGINWTFVPGLPQSFWSNIVATDNGLIMLASYLTLPPKPVYSTNTGSTWASASNLSPYSDSYYYRIKYFKDRIWSVLAPIVSDPGGVQYLYYTTNGATWNGVTLPSSGSVNANSDSMGYDPVSGYYRIFRRDGVRWWRSTDGINWTIQSQSFTSFHPVWTLAPSGSTWITLKTSISSPTSQIYSTGSDTAFTQSATNINQRIWGYDSNSNPWLDQATTAGGYAIIIDSQTGDVFRSNNGSTQWVSASIVSASVTHSAYGVYGQGMSGGSGVIVTFVGTDTWSKTHYLTSF